MGWQQASCWFNKKSKDTKQRKLIKKAANGAQKNESLSNLALLLAILLPHLHFPERSKISKKNHHQAKGLHNKTGILQEQQNSLVCHRINAAIIILSLKRLLIVHNLKTGQDIIHEFCDMDFAFELVEGSPEPDINGDLDVESRLFYRLDWPQWHAIDTIGLKTNTLLFRPWSPLI